MKRISKESQEAYQKYLKDRVRRFDFEHADINIYREMTKDDTKKIEDSARKYWDGVQLEEKEINGISIEIITLKEADPEQYIYIFMEEDSCLARLRGDIFVL